MKLAKQISKKTISKESGSEFLLATRSEFSLNTIGLMTAANTTIKNTIERLHAPNMGILSFL